MHVYSGDTWAQTKLLLGLYGYTGQDWASLGWRILAHVGLFCGDSPHATPRFVRKRGIGLDWMDWMDWMKWDWMQGEERRGEA